MNEQNILETQLILGKQVLEIVFDLLKNDSKTGVVLPLNINGLCTGNIDLFNNVKLCISGVVKMDLLTLIFGFLSLAWLGGLAVIGWAMWKEGREDDE